MRRGKRAFHQRFGSRCVRRLSSIVAVRDRKGHRKTTVAHTQTLGPEPVSWQLLASAWTRFAQQWSLGSSLPRGMGLTNGYIGQCLSFESLLHSESVTLSVIVSDSNLRALTLRTPPFFSYHTRYGGSSLPLPLGGIFAGELARTSSLV